MSTSDLPAPEADAQRLALAWRIAPTTLEFILDIREISRNNRDIIDSLLFAAIMSANMAPVSRDASLQLTYARLDDPAPDEVRRPVSINAVAHSLRIPFETARRRVRRMAKAGALEITPRGVFVPNSAIGGPAFIAAIFKRHERLELFYEVLKGAGALPDAAGAPVAAAPGDPPVRITNRAIWEYVLRTIDELIALTGDALSALILLNIIRQNIAHLARAELAAWASNPDAVAHPVRVAGLAQQLGLSPETSRRYTIALEAAGFCRRTRRGLVAVAPPAIRPALDRAALDNLANVQRMFARLAQLGALDHWDATARAAPARSA